MHPILSPDQRAAAVASRQHGAISHVQAVAAGLSPRQIVGRVQQGRWARRVRGVFVLAGTPDTSMQRLWVTYLAVETGGGVLSHLSAAGRYAAVPYPLLPHCTVPPTASIRAPIGRVHRGTVPSQDTQLLDGLRFTSPSRTIADIASLVDRPTLEEVVDVLFCSRRATADSTLAAAARAGVGRRGLVALRAVVEPWAPDLRPDSVAEVRLLRELRALGAPDVVLQHDVAGPDGRFVGRLDVAIPRLRAGLEYDGRRYHGPRAWGRDERRYEQFERIGWTVEPVSKLDLLPGEPRLRAIVESWERRHAA